ncbi:hypothetical protein [Thermomonospora cellulosilytica]|uniref:N-6 DNA methylase n=1 Tax=Thermomonospora cellulosilytica TaxID=1411118 RepID=A0A7W3MVS8_9ACTN|nr:hypothetical protein [Thermomonospora cellulosilytica]MBA9002815.1 hypothetical protein [Thermomonospora cellulosilytica]
MAVSLDGVYLMSGAEIAELARVQRPVVSTWRRRHPDFPRPVAEERGQLLFDGTQIVEWLVATGRAERKEIEGDLRIYALARLGAELPPHMLVPALTSLICLRHLTGDESLDDKVTSPIGRLRGLAAEIDPDDEFLASEVGRLRTPWLPAIVDELVEAAWSTRGAFERVMDVRDRLGAADLSADRLSPELQSLVVKLADPSGLADRLGELHLADPNAGVGDLIIAVAQELRDDQALRVTACCLVSASARLVRRRLAVRDLTEDDFDVVSTADECLKDANLVVSQLPYRPSEERSPEQGLASLHGLWQQMPNGATAIVIAPADTTAALEPRGDAAEFREALLRTGCVKAVIRLPGGLLPYRPGYEVALWVLSKGITGGEHGKVLLADVSDRSLNPALIDSLVTDVLAWRNADFDGAAHGRVHTVATPIQALVPNLKATGPRQVPPLIPRYLPTMDEVLLETPERVARALELERVLWESRPDLPQFNSGLAASPQPHPPATCTIADLAAGARSRTNSLSVRSGTRLSDSDISVGLLADHSTSYPVIGPSEITEEIPLGRRRVDRVTFEWNHPNAKRSLPGDVIITMTPKPAAIVDHDGYSVIEFPARVLRLTKAGRERFTPRVLAALLNLAGRADGAVRPAQRLNELRLPLLSRSDLERLDQLLAELEDRRERARREIAALDELRSLTTNGLSDGTLTLSDFIR